MLSTIGIHFQSWSVLFLPLVHVWSQPSPANDWWNSSAHYGINNCTGTLITTSDWISPWSHSHLMAKPVKASVGTLHLPVRIKWWEQRAIRYQRLWQRRAKVLRKKRRRDEMRCKPWHLCGRVWVCGWVEDEGLDMLSWICHHTTCPPSRFPPSDQSCCTLTPNHFSFTHRTSVIWLALKLPVKDFSCGFFMNIECYCYCKPVAIVWLF